MARDVAAGPRQSRNEAGAERVRCRREDNRYDRCRLLCRDDHWICIGDDDIDLTADELGREFGGAGGASLPPPILDRKGATLDPAQFAPLLHKNGDPPALDGRRARAQETDGRQLAGLLRARRKRPCSHSAAEERNELAALQSITSLARSNIDVGIVTPIALAVRRFTTSSNVVGCSTGKSAGLAPRRILST